MIAAARDLTQTQEEEETTAVLLHHKEKENRNNNTQRHKYRDVLDIFLGGNKKRTKRDGDDKFLSDDHA